MSVSRKTEKMERMTEGRIEEKTIDEKDDEKEDEGKGEGKAQGKAQGKDEGNEGVTRVHSSNLPLPKSRARLSSSENASSLSSTASSTTIDSKTQLQQQDGKDGQKNHRFPSIPPAGKATQVAFSHGDVSPNMISPSSISASASSQYVGRSFSTSDARSRFVRCDLTSR